MLRDRNRSGKLTVPHHTQMLKGSELLAKVKELGDAPRADVARACGYVSTKKDGSERINFTAFYEAIIDAKGVTLAPPASKAAGPKRGKAPSYKATIAKTGTCPVGGAYTSQAGWGPGDEIGITVTGETITLERLVVAQAAAPEAPAAAVAPVAVTPTPEPVAIPAAATTAVVTYDDAPAPAERELAPF